MLRLYNAQHYELNIRADRQTQMKTNLNQKNKEITNAEPYFHVDVNSSCAAFERYLCLYFLCVCLFRRR